MQLYIGNKNYSSWSLRAWLLMRHAGIPFEEVRLSLATEEDSSFKRRLASLTPAGRVPVLVDDDGFAVWDSLAIAETLAERFPGKRLWPEAPRARARARSLCAEMHSGFAALRSHCGMNIEASLPEIGRQVLAGQPDVVRDLSRIDGMWAAELREHGGPFLFGASFTVADAFFAPVCARVRTYALPLCDASREYADRILALPAMRQWIDEALAEHEFIEMDEPYRRR